MKKKHTPVGLTEFSVSYLPAKRDFILEYIILPDLLSNSDILIDTRKQLQLLPYKLVQL